MVKAIEAFESKAVRVLFMIVVVTQVENIAMIG